MDENERWKEIVHMMQHLIGDLQEHVLQHDREIERLNDKKLCQICHKAPRWNARKICKDCYERKYITPLWNA